MRVALCAGVLVALSAAGGASAALSPAALRPGQAPIFRASASHKPSLLKNDGSVQNLRLRGGAEQRLYQFGAGKADGNREMLASLGNKGANLAEMSNLGINVPPGFTLTASVCDEYNSQGKKLPGNLMEEVLENVKNIEKKMGQTFGASDKPLLLSVRSGASVSMPGMMDTVLNIGLNDKVVEGLAGSTSERFAYDSYRRLLAMFGQVVLGIEAGAFEAEMDCVREEMGVDDDSMLTGEHMKVIVHRFKEIYSKQGVSLPQDPKMQLEMAITKVFDSWENARSVEYRQIHDISNVSGTAINVQAMVFGNLGATSGTGVLFSRNPSTGENHLYGEFLLDAQGEDVVAGVRTPSPIAVLEKSMPELYKELLANVEKLELHFGDMQDVEFTIQDKTLYLLQCRTGKRTGQAAVRIAVEMFKEGAMTKDVAITKVQGQHLDQLLHPQFANEEAYADRVVGRGLPASPGAAVGQIVFTSAEAQMIRAQGGAAILVRGDTSPDDVGGMHASEGILTQRGGMTSHAAVVARGWGKTCVVGCMEMQVDDVSKTFTLGGKTFKSGDWISLNGNSGEVIDGKEPLSPPILAGDLGTFMGWVDEKRRLQVYANADTPEDAAEARRNGASGIGLVRTEHMFYSSEERLKAVRKMIMADTSEQRTEALQKLLPYQRADFEGIFRSMDGCHVTIRLLDPPLHEFLPSGNMEDVCAMIASEHSISKEAVMDKLNRLSEVNPMLGFRGCRLGVVFPEISAMQARGIFEAALAAKAKGWVAVPNIMVPLVGCVKEFESQAKVIRDTAALVFAEKGDSVEFKVGALVEIPRACLIAGQVAKTADFFSFGTNDLTQMTFGFSRDDMATFLPTYLAQGILQKDPFQELDTEGVGELIKMTVDRARAVNPDVTFGVSGEHGGDPGSIKFFDSIGIDYISCSAFRVPIARLAAAKAAVEGK